MNIDTTFSSRDHRGVWMVLAGLAALSAACASGGGTPAPIGAEAEALFAGLSGAWVVDESTGTSRPKLSFLSAGPGAHLDVDNPEQARQMVEHSLAEELQRVVTELRPILEVWIGCGLEVWIGCG